MKKSRFLVGFMILLFLAGCSSSSGRPEVNAPETPGAAAYAPVTASPEALILQAECRIDRFYHSSEISQYRIGELQMRRDIDGDGEEEYIFFSGSSSVDDPTNIVFYYDRIDGEYYSTDLYSMLGDTLGRLNFGIRMRMEELNGSVLPFTFKNQNTDRLIRGEFRFTPETVEVWAESSFDIVPQPEDDFRAEAIRWANEQGYVEEVASLFKTIAGSSFCIPTDLPDSFAIYQERLVRYDALTDSYFAARLWYDRENRAAVLISQRQSGGEEGEEGEEDFAFQMLNDPSSPWVSAVATAAGAADGVEWRAVMAVSEADSEESCRGVLASVKPIEKPFFW